jgi:arabinogalactan oligomer/maltooligosaccharide transport system permease protein
MNYLDYMQMTKGQQIGYKVKSFFLGIPNALKMAVSVVVFVIKKFFAFVGNGFKGYGSRFIKGDIGTKLSYVIMGMGNIFHGQFVKGLIFLAAEVGYFCYMAFFGAGWLSMFYCTNVYIPDENIIQDGVLGNQAAQKIYDELGFETTIAGSNSMHVLLFSVLTLLITVAFFAVYIVNTKSAYQTQLVKAEGKKNIGFIAEMKLFLDERFHVTMLTIPVIGLLTFTVLPIVFTIFIAFTNYDQSHQAPGKLFWWVGLQNFADVFYANPLKSQTFGYILAWTLVWAVFATFTCFFGGIILALLINKKGIKFKGMWRTIFVVTAAVPQFVTLLLIRLILGDDGSLNLMLGEMIPNFQHIRFLTDPTLARITVIVVNMWVGLPYTMLVSSGLLMNIPEDLYESARIDGANAVQQFTKITFPYIFFVMTPYLITTFVGNINNFNVIYLLTGGGPNSTDYYQAGQTDLLVTWLYKLTNDNKDYNLAAVIGIIIFIICAIGSLITFNMSKASKNEEEFS